jgi:hypothetical protein
MVTASDTSQSEAVGLETRCIAISDIDVDYAWNSRSAANVALMTISETDHESTGLEGLMANILAHGQDTAVDVRSTAPPFYKSTMKRYSLVAGFRRVTAIATLNANSELAEEAAKAGRSIIQGVPNGMIRATIHDEMTERQAFMLNARENTNRDGLTPPDVYGLIVKCMTLHGMSVNDTAVALGKSGSAIRQYAAMMKLPPKLITHWRSGGDFEGIRSVKRVGVQELFDLAREPPERQIDLYKRLIQKQEKVVDSSAWLEKGKQRAVAIGATLAKLEKGGMISVNNPTWLNHINVLIGTAKRELRWKDANMLSQLAKASFERELAKPMAAAIELEEESESE